MLMAAAQYVDRPNYAALLLRKSYADLALPGALMDRAHSWWRGKAQWQDTEHTYKFPSGATITFGYLDTEADKYRYQGAELQMVGFDELTQFRDTDYRYLFSRLRRLAGSDIPVRMRGATNPGGFGHCVPYGDILTPQGWRDIREMAIGDPVYTVRPDGVMTESSVAQVHQSHYRGEMVEVDVRGFHMACTPNHAVAKVGGRNIAGRRRSERKAFSLVAFDDLPGGATILRSVDWEGQPLAAITLPSIPITPLHPRRLTQPLSLPGSLFARLLGWYLSEGCCRPQDKTFNIAQMKPRQRDEIRGLLAECRFVSHETPSNFWVTSPEWCAYFMQFGKSRDKFIPEWVKAGSRTDLGGLFLALVDGDGHWTTTRGGSGGYTTNSVRLADDVAEVALKLGYLVRITSRQRVNRRGLIYDVAFKKNRSGGTDLDTGQHAYNVSTVHHRRPCATPGVRRAHYDGDVYCIGVPDTHSFVIRQRGSVWVSGNSWVRQRFMIEGLKKGRVFIPARLEDNPFLDREQYIESLNELDPVTRQQLLDGNWFVRPPGKKFRRDWFDVVDIPAYGAERVRWWDLAATEAPTHRAGKRTSDPDFTVGLLMARAPGARYVIEDVIRFQGNPNQVENAVLGAAESDGIETEIWMEQEPGSSGKISIEHFRQLLDGYAFRGLPSTGNKEVRANPVSATAASEARPIAVLRADWNTDFFEELEQFPDPSVHDDQVDAMSGAFGVLVKRESAEENDFAMGVWRCRSCGEGYIYQPLRACPKCHTRAPAEYSSPA